MLVVIKKCSNKNHWYSNKVGEIYSVKEYNDVNYRVSEDSECTRCIKIEDCTKMMDLYNDGYIL